MLVGAVWIGDRRLSALRARRQRDDLVAAADLYRHRDHELLRRGRRCAISPIPTSPRPSRSATPTWSARSRAPTCIGACLVGILLAIALYLLMTRTTFGFAARVTGGNFRAALAQGSAGRAAHRRLLRDRRRLRGPRRLLRSRGDPGPRQRLARRGLRLHRHPRRRSWRAIIRSRSCRSRSCSAASSPRAA